MEIPMTSSAWHIDRGSAQLQHAHLAATIDLARPARGLVGLRVGNDCLEGAGLLGIELPSSVVSGAGMLGACHGCGSRVTAACGESKDWPVRVEATWRALGPSGPNAPLATLELVVSVETQVPDTRPELAVGSVLPTTSASRLVDAPTPRFETIGELPCAIEPDAGPGCLLFRFPGSEVSYAEMVHPLDFLQDRLECVTESPRGVRLRHRLFGGRLEKGVILRARVCGVFLRREGDARIAAQSYTSFVAAEPPLGT
jgi:hypothetical protein